MYLPRHYTSHDPAALDALIAADPFITLVTVRDGVPTVNHLPVLHARDGGSDADPGRIVLRGHWAKANPQSTHAGQALAIVHGPHAYVSPSWYPDKVPQSRVPTWNYVVAHLHGTLEIFDDAESLASIVSDLSDTTNRWSAWAGAMSTTRRIASCCAASVGFAWSSIASS
jgi:transcriptional regulator